MSQTAYTQRLVPALAGELACPFQDATMDSKINAAAMPAGVYVARDGADDAVRVPATSADVTAQGSGFTHLNVSKEPGKVLDYDAKAGVTVMRAGKMWVLCETAAVMGAPVFARFTANGGNTQLGKVRNDVDTANAVAIPNCRFGTTLASAGLVMVELIGP